MKQIKIVFETDSKKIGYLIDVEKKNFKSGSFTDKYEITDVSQDAFIDDRRFFIQQIVNVITGALNS